MRRLLGYLSHSLSGAGGSEDWVESDAGEDEDDSDSVACVREMKRGLWAAI